MSTTRIEILRRTADELQSELDALLNKVQAEGRKGLTKLEARRFEAMVRDRDITVRELNDAVAQEQRRTEVAEVAKRFGVGSRATIGHEAYTYRKGGEFSYLRDRVRSSLYGDTEAGDRLQRHAREVEVEQRALSTTDGAGGEFAPPLWIVDEYVALARSGRVTADRLNPQELPAGTDQINLPSFSTGTATAVQSAQNSAVQNTDATTATVTSGITTVAGMQILSVQMIEQSPINVDEAILGDLFADMTRTLDQQAISGSGTSGQLRGLLNVAGIVAVTYTDASPAMVGSGKLWGKIADTVQQIASNRFAAPDTIVVHPRRWSWMNAALDAQNRPLIVPGSSGPTNAVAALDSVQAEGFVGNLQGLQVYVDPNIPTNLGAGTNEDRIIIGRLKDSWLYESAPRLEMFREPKADQLSVLLRVYQYAGLVHRYAKSIGVISGTGLVTPTF